MEKEPSNINDNISGRGLGNQFKVAREKNKQSLDDVAAELFILKRHLDAIERDDYDNLPQIAFTRGFVMSYAKYLKLDVDTTMAVFDANHPVHQKLEADTAMPESTKPLGKLNRNENRKTSFGPYSILFAVLCLVALGFLYKVNSSKNKTENDTVSALQHIQNEDSETIAQDSVLDESATSETSTSTNTNLTGQAATFSNTNTTNDTNSANKPDDAGTELKKPIDPNAKPAELVFWVRRGTTINITDQTGAVLMSGKKSRGEHKAKGIPPFKVQIDNVKNVALTLDKKRVRVNKYADTSNQADFTLNK